MPARTHEQRRCRNARWIG